MTFSNNVSYKAKWNVKFYINYLCKQICKDKTLHKGPYIKYVGGGGGGFLWGP